MRTLVLYQPDLLPTDIDGDGRIETTYRRDRLEMGSERFNPELLFRVPPRYRGWVTGPDGNRFFSFELLNAEEAYGRKLLGLKDDNHDGIPDVVECTSTSAGRP